MASIDYSKLSKIFSFVIYFTFVIVQCRPLSRLRKSWYIVLEQGLSLVVASLVLRDSCILLPFLSLSQEIFRAKSVFVKIRSVDSVGLFI